MHNNVLIFAAVVVLVALVAAYAYVQSRPPPKSGAADSLLSVLGFFL